MKSINVLVVDDELGIRSGIERILSGYECRMEDFNEAVSLKVETVGTGLEAIELAEKSRPDIILLDYKLPDVHGLDVMNALKERKVDIMTIMITAYASLDVAISATKGGAFDFIPKPFTPDELKSVITKAVRNLYLSRKAKALEDEKRQVRFQFVSVLAHELKSPINAIDGYLEILATGKEFASNESASKMLGRCKIRIDGMRRMINDLLDMTAIESGKRERKLSRIDLFEKIKETTELLNESALAKDIKITNLSEPGCVISADGDEVSMMLNNLVSNAIKYNKKGGAVEVNVATSDGGFEVSVKDTGIGMTKDEQQHLFKEFTRIKNEKTVGVEGSGLGLSTVKKLVDLNGGRISVESEAGIGSRFTIFLPTKVLN